MHFSLKYRIKNPAVIIGFTLAICACGTPKPVPQTVADNTPDTSLDAELDTDVSTDNSPEPSQDSTESQIEADTDDIGPEILALKSNASVTIEEVMISHPNVSMAAANEAGQSTLRHHRLCYDQTLQHASALAGTIQIKVIIDGDGNVTKVSTAKSDFNAGLLDGCVQSGFYGLTIEGLNISAESLTAPIEITYKLRFSPGSTP